MKPVILILLASILSLTSCEPPPVQPHPATIIPLNPTFTPIPTPTPPYPNSTEIPIITVTPPATPVPFAIEEPVAPGLAGAYTLKGTAPDGRDYAGKLTITLNPGISNDSTMQAEYHLAWNTAATGAGILIKDAIGNRFLAAGFGGPACSAAFYYAFPYLEGNTSTFTLYGIRIEPGSFELGSEIVSPIVPRPYLVGDYYLIGTNANGNEYKGTLSITQHAASVWQLAWNVGLTAPGIGISLNKSLFAAAFGGEGCGVAVYKVNTDGSLHATWAVWGGDQVGEETATK
ncbi:MAG TPA: hypothetical protein VII93_00965 [Anaerolineales bacterium]